MTEQPFVNILIRSHRPLLLPNAVQSVENQTYKNWRIHIHETEGTTPHYQYNLFCNNLMNQVQRGWMFFLDDDDILDSDTALEEIAKELTDDDTAIICQMRREGRAKPSDELMDKELIVRGKIGTPCIILHSKHKNVSRFTNSAASEYRFATEMRERMKVRFVKKILVNAGRRSFGK